MDAYVSACVTHPLPFFSRNTGTNLVNIVSHKCKSRVNIVLWDEGLLQECWDLIIQNFHWVYG